MRGKRQIEIGNPRFKMLRYRIEYAHRRTAPSNRKFAIDQLDILEG
jgi:hypothetical protein